MCIIIGLYINLSAIVLSLYNSEKNQKKSETTLKSINQHNKDDNIHISEALKLKDKQTLTLVDCQN